MVRPQGAVLGRLRYGSRSPGHLVGSPLAIELLVLLLSVFMPDFGLVEEKFSKPCILNPY